MALHATDAIHQQQIDAGTIGRKRGHKFEAVLAQAINEYRVSDDGDSVPEGTHLFCGNPAALLIKYISANMGITVNSVHAWWLGGLATSGSGDSIIGEDGTPITKCKSDVLLEIDGSSGVFRTGVSVKTCSKKTPTNDQMYFTTASAFCKLLDDNGIPVNEYAKDGMARFCGDAGHRPLDILPAQELANRISDPRRFYWEELPREAIEEWQHIFSSKQDEITKLLFQKAYKSDPYPPDYLLHQTVKYDNFSQCPIALFSIDEIVELSHRHSGYILVPYTIKKGTYKNDNTEHFAPRFGFIQFQRGGQKQHPTQLQFNLKAGYFNHL